MCTIPISMPSFAVRIQRVASIKYRVLNRTDRYSRPDVFDDRGWNQDIPAINANWMETNNDNAVLGRNEFFVAGEYGYQSVDSHVWDPLLRRNSNIFGTARFNVFLPSHAGRVSEG